MKTMNFPIPANWQDFQILIKDILNEKYDGGFDVYGRNGQSQDGVDILKSQKNSIIGVQCKRINSKLTLNMIKDEVKKSDNSNLGLTKYIFATTNKRDKEIQKEIATFNKERYKKSLFEIEIWFWETIEDEINDSAKIWDTYYTNIFSKIDSKDKENHILELIHTAFSRPAFLTPFRLENNDNDFFQAIKDTQEFLNTGKLKNRNGEYIAGSLSYKKLSNSQDVKNIFYATKLLQQIRDYITLGIKNGQIKVCEGKTCFCFKNRDQSEKELDKMRHDLLVSLNQVFIRNNMNQIMFDFEKGIVQNIN
jgi:hypothetical protein